MAEYWWTRVQFPPPPPLFLYTDNMKKVAKWIGLSVLAILVFLIYSGTYLDIPREELESRYAIGASQFLNLDDGSIIHYRDEGNDEGPVIVLLHGFNGSLFNFERLVHLLAQDFRLVSLDLPAFGLTGAVPSENYTTENFMKTVSKFTHYLGIEKFSIVGNSMGGHVAWRYALEYPDQIQGLILIAAGGVITEKDLERLDQQKNDSPIVWKLMDSSFARKILLFFTPRFFAEQGLLTAVADPKLVTEELVSQFHELALLEGSREAIMSMIRGDRHSSGGPEIYNQISAPTLVIHGEEDNLIKVESSKYFEENIPKVEVKIYSNIGHLPMYEDPERTAKDIRSFIKGSNS